VDSHPAARHIVTAIVTKEEKGMAETEISEETRERAEQVTSADIVVGIAGAVPPADLRVRAGEVLAELAPSAGSLRFVFAWPGTAEEAGSAAENQNGHPAPTLLPYAAPPANGDFWAPVSANQRAVLALAASLNARACIVLGADLAALQSQAIQLFSYAVLERQCGLVMPIYPAGKYDGLINTGILSPLSRTLYGKKIQFPLAFDFAASGAMCARLAQGENSAQNNGLLWPVIIAATQSPQTAVGQVHIDVHHQTAAAGLELSVVLAQLAGSLFAEMESGAAQWQRVRGSQPAPVWGSAPAEKTDQEPIDAQPMLDSFLLGSKNLEEVWRLVLPPNSMLELRHLTRLAPEQFRMPDELWASIVYDFALAWRLRTISRVHLLGALTPLYLGWVASWVREVAALPRASVEQRIEQLNRAWEEKKPYLLSRWRWPDRFNP
jgi:glucosylglycerate synthase